MISFFYRLRRSFVFQRNFNFGRNPSCAFRVFRVSRYIIIQVGRCYLEFRFRK
jgi:hypothetical protein